MQRTSAIWRILLCGLASASLGMALAVVSGCGVEKSPASGGTPNAEAKGTAAKELTTADEVLEAMVAAYQKAQSYSDKGVVRLVAEVGDEKIDQSADFSVALVRPNKVRVNVYQAKLVSDGKQLHATTGDAPDRVLVKEAPAEISLPLVYSDRYLAAMMTQGFAGAVPQLMLLLEKEPLKALLADTEKPVIGEPGEIDRRKYYRVQIKGPDGTAVFWIDQQTLVLRRVVFPTDSLRQMLAGRGTVKNVSVVADFAAAQFNGTLDAKEFQFNMPAGAEVAKFLLPPHPAQLLGKKVADFQFVDLDGRDVSAQSLAGKIVVLDLWASWCGPCRQSLPNLEKVYQHYKDNDKIAMLTVSVDDAKVDNKALLDVFKQLGVSVPILRDAQQNILKVFKSTDIPSTFILDAKGVVQDCESGANPDLVAALTLKLEKLLGGESIYQQPLAEYNKKLKEYEDLLDKQTKADAAGEAAGNPQEDVPKANIAPRSEPKTLRLSSLWKSSDVKAPGNILVIAAPNAPPRLAVIDGLRAVAEVGLDGKLIATHPLELNADKNELVANLRTFVAADGKRYFAGFASGQQRLHVFDENWKKLFSFPEDALENKHDGIADVQFGDLDGDGTPKLYVGYWGAVGVQAVSLQGQRLYSNRTISWVLRVAVGAPDAQGRRSLFCINNNGSLAVLDGQLKPQGEVSVPDRSMQQIFAADLDGSGQPLWCAMSSPRLGENVAIGLSLKGEELWNYTLPSGVPQQPIEQVIAGQISRTLPGQWLLPGSDGSIHIIAADGKPIDRFNYGAVLQGLATVEQDSQAMLIVASPQGLEALRVE